MYCRFCGSNIPDDSVFCSSCGEIQKANEINTIDADIKDAPEQSEGVIDSINQKPKHKLWRNKWFWVIIAVTIIFIGGSAIGCRAFHNPPSIQASSVEVNNPDSKAFNLTMDQGVQKMGLSGIKSVIYKISKDSTTLPDGLSENVYKGDTVYSYPQHDNMGGNVDFCDYIFLNSKGLIWKMSVISQYNPNNSTSTNFLQINTQQMMQCLDHAIKYPTVEYANLQHGINITSAKYNNNTDVKDGVSFNMKEYIGSDGITYIQTRGCLF